MTWLANKRYHPPILHIFWKMKKIKERTPKEKMFHKIPISVLLLPFQIFDNKSDLLVHSQTVHKADPKPYRCPTCQKCFANSSYLSQHARIHAGIKPYKCQICERRFTQLCHLQQHIRTHTGEKPYKCQHPGCGKAFSQLSNLQSHSRSHMTDKPYRCNSCYKCFGDEQGLRDHIPKHSETKHLKTFICRICGKSYTQETYLARHMTKHQGCDPQANMLNLTSLRHQQQQQLALQQAQQQAQQANHGGLVGPHGTGTSSAGYSPTGHSGTNLSSPGSQSGGLQQHPGAGLHNMSGSGAHGAASPHGQSSGGHSGLTHRQGDLPDIKPLLEGNGFDASSGGSGGAADVNKPSSAFMPLAHSYPGAAAAANLITNTSVPSQFPFGSPPRLPPSTTTPLNSPLARLSPSVNSAVAAPPPPAAHHYFPFDFPRAARDTMDGRMGPMPHDLARSLISLQQIQRMNCVFPKSEPTTPAVAHKDFAAVHKDYTAPHKDYS